MKTVFDLIKSGESLEDRNYLFQNVLTPILDDINGDFNQAIINQIVLWKVNRYAAFNSAALEILNQINKETINLDEALTRKALEILLPIKGIQLPMASTILRFKNPNIYQIIDQRVYRFIKGTPIQIPTNVFKQIDYYIEYLKVLRAACQECKIDFKNSDRVLYSLDKTHNRELKLENY